MDSIMDDRNNRPENTSIFSSSYNNLSGHLKPHDNFRNSFIAKFPFSRFALIYLLVIYGVAGLCGYWFLPVPFEKMVTLLLIASAFFAEVILRRCCYSLSFEYFRRVDGIRFDGITWKVQCSGVWTEVDKPKISQRTYLFLSLSCDQPSLSRRPLRFTIWRDMITAEQWHKLLIILNI